MTNTNSSEQFQFVIKTDGWTIPQATACLKQAIGEVPLDEKTICCKLLTWLDANTHVANHATGRRFTRLQFIENTLSAAGYMLTSRDFKSWFEAQSQANKGDWRPHDFLPYTPIDPRLAEQETRIDQLEHDMHQMEVARNRAKAELAHVQAERDHFIAVHSEEIYKSVSAGYQNSASWRVTKPLRKLMAWRRGEKFVEAPVQKPAAETLIPPWERAGYSVEKAWKAPAVEDFDRNDYAEWIRRYDNPSTADIASSNVKAQVLAAQPEAPTFSLLMAVEQPHLAWLKEAVASVQAQIYANWELCVAVSTHTDAATRIFLESVAESDQRVKLVHATPSTENLLTKAYEIAVGDWIGAINAINIIAKEATNTPATAVFTDKNLEILYTDCDKLIAPDFQRAKPDFKPDWNLDLFLSSGSTQNYTQDLCFFKADLVRELARELGGFGEFGTGFDLTLRALKRVQPTQIYHIPQVLMHVRDNPADENHDAGQAKNQYIQYPLPASLPLVSLIIPTKNNVKLLRQCLDSILSQTSYTNFEILVIDNGSDQDETLDYLKSLRPNPKIRVIRDNDAFNYSAQNNYAVTFAKGEILGLINDDIEVISADWLTEMVSHALRHGVGAVGARLWYPDHTLQHAGMVLVGGVARHVHKHLPEGESGFNDRAVLTQNFSAVTGACLVVKKALFEQVGGLNDQELAVGFNDVDFCLKLVEAGYRNVWTPYAELIHYESATRGQDDSPEKQRRAEKELRYMRKRWGDKLYSDPAYNPNLSDGHDDMSLAWPPRNR